MVGTVPLTRASAGAVALVAAAWACGGSDHSTPGTSGPDGSVVMSSSGGGGPSLGVSDSGGSSGTGVDGGGSGGAGIGSGSGAQTGDSGNEGGSAEGGGGGCASTSGIDASFSAGAPAAYPYVSDMGDGTYRNPVVLADYSDPDVVRVGEDYYLVSSSFTNTPGLPILHSRDLVNWTIAGHVIVNLPNARYAQYIQGAGAWAPSIREHRGTFYVFFPTPDEGIYVVTAPSPLGPWGTPNLLVPGLGLIDPCPLWDDDGNAYLVHAYAKSRAGINDILHVRPMSPDATQMLGAGQDVFGPDPTNYPTLEGPKFYKRNGFYYLLAPAGGVTGGFQVALRSSSVYGPYQAMRVLEQGSTSINGPHQGGMVDTPSGSEWWFVHFQDDGIYGRILHLEPVTWQNDWPLMGAAGAGGIREPVLTHEKPDVCPQPVAVPQTGDDFSGPDLSPAWQWHANHVDTWYSLTARPAYLRLFPQSLPGGAGTGLAQAPNLLLQKLPSRSFDVDTVVDLAGSSGQSTAGLVVAGVGYPALSVAQTSGGFRVDLLVNDQAVATDTVAAGPVHLRLAFADGGRCTFSYGTDGSVLRSFSQTAQAQQVSGSWVGVEVGLFAVAPAGATASGQADFSYFRFGPFQ
jgi:beta-xylosidase